MNWTYCIFQLILLRTRNLLSYQIYGGSVYCSLIFKAVNEVLTSEIAKDLYQRLRSYMWRRNILSNGSYEFLFER